MAKVDVKGHRILCTGDINLVNAKVEQCHEDPPSKAADVAAYMESLGEEERKRKAIELKRFRKEVKNRVNSRKKMMEKEMAATSSKAMQSERNAAERALKLGGKYQSQHSAVVSHDVEDAKVMAGVRDCNTQSEKTGSSALQAARNALLSHRLPGDEREKLLFLQTKSQYQQAGPKDREAVRKKVSSQLKELEEPVRESKSPQSVEARRRREMLYYSRRCPKDSCPKDQEAIRKKVLSQLKELEEPVRESKGPKSVEARRRREMLYYSRYKDKDQGESEIEDQQEGKPNDQDATERPYSSFLYVMEASSEDTVKRLANETENDKKDRDPVVKKFTSAGQLEYMERKQAGKQFSVFRRLYSDLERERVRKTKVLQSYSKHVEALKERKEAERKVAEEALDLYSTISADGSKDQLNATEWNELMLLEKRKKKLQKAKETKRYIAALKARLKHQIELKKLQVPPLCSCGKTVWDTNPETCANNCAFYRNPKAYVKALTKLLRSFNLDTKLFDSSQV